MAVLLGLLDPFFYDLYQLCQNKSITEISEFLGLDADETKIFIDKLIKNGLIKDPKRR